MTERWPTYLIFLPVFLGAGLFVYRRLLRLFSLFPAGRIRLDSIFTLVPGKESI